MERIISAGNKIGNRESKVSNDLNYFRWVQQNKGNIKIPIISVAIEGWELASIAFANEHRSYLRRQQWRSFFGALLNVTSSSEWFRILKSPEFKIILQYRPKLYFKIFNVYMSIHWDKKQKIKVILDTYRFLMGKGDLLMNLLRQNDGFEMVSFSFYEKTSGVLVLRYDHRYRKEGELVFSFECDALGGRIIDAAFSFEKNEEDNWVCRIGCVQGHSKTEEYYAKIAQKMMHGLRPKSFIIFAIQEFSRLLGVSAIYGAGDSIQAYRRKHAIHIPWRHSIYFNYNSIWSESGGTPDEFGWYKLPLVPARKEIHEIKTTKRAQYARRYQMLDDIVMKFSERVNYSIGNV